MTSESIKHIYAMKNIYFIIVLTIMAQIALSCTQSDPDTERKIVGSWRSNIALGYDDDESLSENITYNADHTMTATIKYISADYGEKYEYYTATYTGRWSASDTRLTEDIDEESICITSEYMSDVEIEAFKKDLVEEGTKSVSRILVLTSDKLEVRDAGGDRYIYFRD